MLGWSEGGTAGQYVALGALACKHTERRRKKEAGHHKILQEQ